jgi:hypothetical protein
LHDPPKFTQFGIFCLKICHLATLDSRQPKKMAHFSSSADISTNNLAAWFPVTVVVVVVAALLVVNFVTGGRC